MKIAIVGAGMAGLTAAQILEGVAEVTVFDKSKGTGGRLSSRFHSGGWIDHGAPCFSITIPDFINFTRQHLGKEVFSSWRPNVLGHSPEKESVQFIGVPRNSAITRALLGNLKFQSSTRISKIVRTPDGWKLFSDEESLLGTWHKVIIAIPAPQALLLVSNEQAFFDQMHQVKMEPCWVAAIKTQKLIKPEADIRFFEHSEIDKIVTNSNKPERKNKNVYLVHMTRGWSEAHLEDPEKGVSKKILELFKTTTEAGSNCELLFVHRWRYAFSATPLGKPFLWDAEKDLGLCGDWCIGRRVEDAWQSGYSLAKHIIHSA